MSPFAFTLVIFFLLLTVSGLVFYAVLALRDPNRMALQQRIESYAAATYLRQSDDILRKKRVMSDIPVLNLILMHLPGIQRLDTIVRQAKVPYPLGFFLLLSAVMGLAGFIAGMFFLRQGFFAALIALFSGATPFFVLHVKKDLRVKKFRRQLPEALDLIARALRAGHAFTSGLRLAADEFDEPLGPEFKETLEEINFGLGTAEALRNITGRIDCQDLNFFVVSVILQQETGGNLAEIIESIAHLIRERFKFQDKVRALSAEGKLSALVLIMIPIFLLLYLRITSPAYIGVLFTEEAGRLMLGFAGVMMVFGILVMKRIINIDY